MATVPLEAWRALYEQAIRIKELAPWTWMEESELFGVEDPESKEVAYVSISGALGQHLAVIAYLGDEALHRFLRIQASRGLPRAQDVLEMRQLQASFEDRERLAAEDVRTIRSLGMKFRGSREWPLFRSIYPGCYPWYFDEAEVRLMTVVLAQAAHVASRLKDDPDLLERPGGGCLVVRRRNEGTPGASWEDERRELSRLLPVRIEYQLSDETIRDLRAKPRIDGELQVDVVMLLGAKVREKGQRPYFPYVVLAVRGEDGMVLGAEVLSPLPSLAQMWSHVVPTLCSFLSRTGLVPSTIQVRTGTMESLLAGLASLVGIRVRRVEELPALEQVAQDLIRFLE